MIIADILLITVAIIALIFASLVDLRIKEVPDWLNFSLIIVALGIRLIHAIVYSEWQYFYYGLLGLGSMFLLGMSLFYTKQWGGGDTKLLIALGTVFATRPYFIKPGINLPFIFIIVVNLMIIGALYSIVWSLVLLYKNRNVVSKEIKKVYLEKRKMRYMYILFTLSSLIFVFLSPPNMLVLTIGITVLLLIYPYLYIIVKSVENVGMIKWVDVNKLVEGDWVAEPVKVKGKVICGPKDLGLEKEQIKALKKHRVKKVLIKEGIAFVPSILLGVIATLIYGNFIFFILT